MEMKNMNKAITITKSEFIERGAEVSAELAAKHTKSSEDPMMGLMVTMLAADVLARLTHKFFDDENENKEEE